jgi:competence transcription factor ComK
MNGEKGQALPLAMIALTIGSLLVAPFLGHASSSVIGSRTYADAIAYRNACDAGVEHGIWRLVYGGLPASLPNPGDHITYQLTEAINGVIPTVTITANATGGGATGNITKSIKSSLDFATEGYTPKIVQVSGNIYAIVYTDSINKNGYLKTMSISNNGDIGAVGGPVAFDTSACFTPTIISVSGNYYAIAYAGSKNGAGYLKTVPITSGGTIGTVGTRFTVDSSACFNPDIIYVSGNIYAIAYTGSNNGAGYIKPVSITSGGVISSGGSRFTFVSSACFTPSIIQISGIYYAIAYAGSKNNTGLLKTVSITSGGVISAVGGPFTFDSSSCYTPTIIYVSGNYYAIAYRGTSNGSLKTVSISSTGTIGTVKSTYPYSTSMCFMPDITQVASGIFVIAYSDGSYFGYLKTVSIGTDGIIVTPAIDTYNFDTASCYESNLIHITGDVFAITYRGTGNDGYLKTIGITTGIGVNTYSIVASAGDTSIQAYVIASNTTASIVSWLIK